jgi:hypothetical protein
VLGLSKCGVRERTYQVFEIFQLADFVGRQFEGVHAFGVDAQVLELLTGQLIF